MQTDMTEPLAWFTFDLLSDASSGLARFSTASSLCTASTIIGWSSQLTVCCSSRQEEESGATDNPGLANRGANKRTSKVKKKSGGQ